MKSDFNKQLTSSVGCTDNILWPNWAPVSFYNQSSWHERRQVFIPAGQMVHLVSFCASPWGVIKESEPAALQSTSLLNGGAKIYYFFALNDHGWENTLRNDARRRLECELTEKIQPWEVRGHYTCVKLENLDKEVIFPFVQTAIKCRKKEVVNISQHENICDRAVKNLAALEVCTLAAVFLVLLPVEEV